LVVKPQTKKVPASSRKSRDLLPSSNALKAAFNGLLRSRVSAGRSACAPSRKDHPEHMRITRVAWMERNPQTA
jgi:hypothetical protein